MRRFCIPVALYAAMCFAGIPTRADDASTAALRVMTFNVRYGTAKDGEDAWEKRRDIVIDVIKTYNPDVIGTQECLDFQADYIVQQLPEYRWYGIGRDRMGDGERMAVIYKSKILSPISVDNFWLSETPNVAGSKAWGANIARMVTYTKFRHIPTDSNFHHYNTHFDHQSELARVNSAQLLRDRSVLLAEGSAVVITGDFNSAAQDGEAWTILTATSGLYDSLLTAEKKSGPNGTFGGFKAPREDGARIDWILYRGPLAVKSYESVTFNKDGRYPSDHIPVVVDFELKK
jgi:endonuclease/exonuclease/phosphatase family metal-dependent hydrolase